MSRRPVRPADRSGPDPDPRFDPVVDPWAEGGAHRSLDAPDPERASDRRADAEPESPDQNGADQDGAYEDWTFGGQPRSEPREPVVAPALGAPRPRRRGVMARGAGLARRARLFALGARGAFALAAGFAALLVLIGLPLALDDLRTWRAAARISAHPPSAGALFERLAAAGLIALDPDGFALRLAPEDLALRRKLPGAPADAWPADLSADAAQALEWAHADGPGASLRAEIAAWNAGLAIAAVRDAEGGAWVAETILTPAERGGDVADAAAPGFPARLGGDPPAERYGFFGWSAPDAPAPTGPWSRAAPTDGVRAAGLGGDRDQESLRIRFRRLPVALSENAPVVVEDEAFVVDVLGRFPRVSGAEIVARRRLCAEEAVARADDPAAPPLAAPGRTASAGEAPVEAVAFRRGPAPDCGPPDLQGPSDGHRLSLAPTGGPIVIGVEPAPSLPARLRAFAAAPLVAALPDRVRFDPARAGWVPYRGSEAVTLWCGVREAAPSAPAAQIGPACAALWRDPDPKPVRAFAPDAARPAAPAPTDAPKLETGDGVVLLDPAGRPTADAAALGLAPLIGAGPADRFGLAAALRGREGAPARLTLRADWQRAAAATLRSLDSDPRLRALLPERLDDRRLAALVAVDAGDDPRTRGAVLAAAVAQPGAAALAERLAAGPLADGAAWNALGYDLWRPRASPLAPRAFARADARAAPGSTLKTLTALALIRAAALREFDPDLRLPQPGPLHQAIFGAETAQAAPGLTLPDGARIAPQGWVEIAGRFWARSAHDCVAGRSGPYGWRDRAKICNFTYQGRLEPHDFALLAPQETGCPTRPGGAPDRPQLGLCEATATSLNSWFVASALGLSALPAPDPAQTSVPTRDVLARLAARTPSPDARDLSRAGAPLASRLRAEPIRFDPPADQPLFQLGLYAIGQNAQAAPLSIAALYGGIGAGCRLDPFLLARPDGRAPAELGCRPLLFDPARDPELNDVAAGRAEARRRETYALELIRGRLIPGLRAVVSSRPGTADAAFRGAPFAPFLRGKTGTAQTPLPPALGGGLIDTAWFAGWAEADAFRSETGAPLALGGAAPRRVAFACMVTDAAGSGGRICAPLVRRFLEALRGDVASLPGAESQPGAESPPSAEEEGAR